MFIAIAGNMGAGKSTLTDRLAKRLGWKALPEPAIENPYLADFYADMNRWAFHSQVYILSNRLNQYQDFIANGNHVIQDRSLYENAEVFARLLYERGNMSERDWQTYSAIYETMTALLPAPNLIIYLEASVPTLIKRIGERGREFEQKIDPDYLESLNQLYDKWISSTTIAPIVKINIDETDFEANERALGDLVEKIVGMLPHQQLPI